MSQTYGVTAPPAHAGSGRQEEAARYLVLIDSASSGARQARLFSATRQLLSSVDAGAPEIQQMTEHLEPASGADRADGADWNAAFAGHSSEERAAAQVYVLDV